jgi:hypothetical protein
VKAHEVIEEIQRIQSEFGPLPVVVVDEMQPGWAFPVTAVEFDAENQAITIAADR